MSAVGWKGGGDGWGCGMVLIPEFHMYYFMITAIEYLFLALLTLGTGLGSAYIVYKVVEPRAKRLVSGFTNTIPARMRKELGSALKDMTENIDLGDVAGQLGSGEGEGNPLGALSGLLGGGSGGLGDLIGLLGQFSGKQTGNFKKPDHRPGK